jgi:hypothetical protein
MDRRRRTERGGGARGGGAVELGEDLWMLDCGAVRRGKVVLAFYRRPKAVRGGGYFRREAAGELARLLEVRPDSAATGDKTARAAAGQHMQGRFRPAVVSAASTRPTRRLGVMAAGRVPAGTGDPAWRGPVVA